MFQGRIGVGQYWLSVLLLLVLTIAMVFALWAVYYLVLFPLLVKVSNAGLGMTLLLAMGGGLLVFIPLLITLPFAIGLQIRRLHDIGLTGWVALGLFVLSGAEYFLLPPTTYAGQTPVISPIAVVVSLALSVGSIILLSWPGTKGPNTYGDIVRYRSLWAAIRGKRD